MISRWINFNTMEIDYLRSDKPLFNYLPFLDYSLIMFNSFISKRLSGVCSNSSLGMNPNDHENQRRQPK
jgi:hypothetical protein